MPIYNVIPKDPNEAIVVEMISKIPTWLDDVASLKLMDRPIEDQSSRETRESIKAHPLPDYRYVHDFDFGPKVSKIMENLKSKIKSNCPDGEPRFERHPDWRSYVTIYTQEERREIERAERQRSYKKIIVLELEEILIPNVELAIDILKLNKEIRRRNQWLCALVNDLPDLEIINISDDSPYFTTLEVIATKGK